MGVEVDKPLETSTTNHCDSFTTKSDLIDSAQSISILSGVNSETQQIKATKECQHCLVQQETYKQYLGKEYYYVFDNGVIENDGRCCHIRGRLLAIFPFGQIPHQDLAGIPRANHEALEWANKIGLASKFRKRLALAAPECVIALLCAGVPLAESKLAVYFIYYITVLDDILDNLRFQKRKEPFAYKNILADIQTMLSYLLEKDEAKLPIIYPDDSSHAMDKLAPLCAAMRSIRTLVQASGMNPCYFLNDFIGYLNYCALETSERNYTSQVLEYAYAKDRCQALTLTLELCFMVNKLDIPSEIRSNALFSLLCHLCGVHVGLVNDLLSLKKEFLLGETKNTVRVWANIGRHTRHQLTLQEAFDSVVEETNAIAKRIIDLQTKILTCFPDNELVHKSVLVAMNYANADLNYYVGCGRYASNDIYLQFNA